MHTQWLTAMSTHCCAPELVKSSIFNASDKGKLTISVLALEETKEFGYMNYEYIKGFIISCKLHPDRACLKNKAVTGWFS